MTKVSANHVDIQPREKVPVNFRAAPNSIKMPKPVISACSTLPDWQRVELVFLQPLVFQPPKTDDGCQTAYAQIIGRNAGAQEDIDVKDLGKERT